MTREAPQPHTLHEAKDLLGKYHDTLVRLGEAPRLVGNVVQFVGKDMLLASPNGMHLVRTPDDIKIDEGDSVVLHAETGQIIDVFDTLLEFGSPLSVLRIDGHRALVNAQGLDRWVNVKRFPVEEGDQIILDASGHVAVHHIKIEPKKVKVDTVSWDDIGGQAEAKATLREAVELPALHAALFASYGKQPTKGVLLYGPPGCGKTMLGKALATSLGGGFFYVKGPELLNSYVGATEAAIRDMFAQARKHIAKTDTPAVIFLDEGDALLGVRGARNSFMEKTVVPQFLTEMDGADTSKVIVIIATNRPDQLDPAVTREGRIDRKVKVERPDKAIAAELFTLYLSKTVTKAEVGVLSATGAHLLFSDKFPMYNVKTADGGDHVFALSNMASGSLVANIVDQAVSRALTRDIAAGRDTGEGLMTDDIVKAVEVVYHQNRHLHHDAAIDDFVDGRVITHKEKVHAAAVQ